MEYLDFEKPIEKLVTKLEKAKELGKDKSVKINEAVEDIESQIKEKQKEIYNT